MSKDYRIILWVHDEQEAENANSRLNHLIARIEAQSTSLLDISVQEMEDRTPESLEVA